MFDMAKKRWEEYWNWTLSLPTVISVTVFFASAMIPVLVLVFILFAALDSHFKMKCLDSELARRWSPKHRVCEEYHDGKWIEPSLADNIYYYNNAASREN